METEKEEYLAAARQNAVYLAKWLWFSLLMGTGCGLIGAAFGRLLSLASETFGRLGFLLYLMPAAGIVIVLIHELFHQVGNKGTNLVLESVSSDETISPSVLPCIFSSAILTHFVGGSAGKVGASLQMGGCFGNIVGEIFHLDQRDKKVLIMSGMSGCFAAIFGTPLAAAVFGMEVISVGVLYYAALLPCVLSAFLAAHVAGLFGVTGDKFPLETLPAADVRLLLLILLLAVLGAVCSGLFLSLIHI